MTEATRGRPRAFDAEEALESAFEVFLAFGYEGASLDSLTGRMGINRPSFYAAFGDKAALYDRLLSLYRDRVLATLSGLIERAETLEEALAGCFASAVRYYCRGASLGCLVTATAVTRSGKDAAVRDFLAGFLERCDAAIAEGLARFVSTDEAQALAPLVSAMLHTLSVRARAGVEAEALEALARDAARRLVASARI